MGFDVFNIQLNKNKYSKNRELNVVLTLQSQKKRTQEEILTLIGEIEGVSFVERL